MSELIKDLPIIPLRGMTILPYMVIHFDVSRKKSINSVEYAIKNGQRIFLAAQKDQDIMDPVKGDIFSVGTVCEIKHVVKMPGGLVRVLVRGMFRAELENFSDNGKMLMGDVLPDIFNESFIYPTDELDARADLLKEMLKRFYVRSDRDQGENIARIDKISNLDELVYKSIADSTTDYLKRQEVLEIEDLFERYDYVCDIINYETGVLDIRRSLAENVKKRVDRNQKEYVLREQIHAIREELGDEDTETEADEFREAVAALDAPEEVVSKLMKEIRHFEGLSSNSSESAVVRTYIETMLELPWNKCTKDNDDIRNAQKVLENDHYGLKKVKERIIEYIAVRSLNSQGDIPVICLVGPPGTGKTSIAASVARALNRKYVRICLGGVRDEAEIRGHRKTYVGAMPGRIVTGLCQAGVGNPLMLLDEIDKTGKDSGGDTASALLEILDREQNSAFRDHYIEVPVDLSKVLFIATANDAAGIPKPLLDRMEIIEVNSYTQTEKFHIAKKYLIPKQLKKNGLDRKQLAFSDEAVRNIILEYTKEAGVRGLERKIGEACRKTAKEILMGNGESHRINARNLSQYLGTPQYDREKILSHDAVGVVKGLAWTSVGGTTLDVEACVMPGKGNLILTGQLGDVMKESASVALGYIRAEAKHYGIDDKVFEENDIQLHVPEGAVPKDGPSAGITITLAMLSALTGQKVSHDTAMTGEITLHGNVLPIGGLKEKILAAGLAGVKNVLIPFNNQKDLNDIEEEITEGINITPVKTMEDVVKAALRSKEASNGN